MEFCPSCGAKALDEAIRDPEGSTFRCLFCWKLVRVEREELTVELSKVPEYFTEQVGVAG